MVQEISLWLSCKNFDDQAKSGRSKTVDFEVMLGSIVKSDD